MIDMPYVLTNYFQVAIYLIGAFRIGQFVGMIVIKLWRGR